MPTQRVPNQQILNRNMGTRYPCHLPAAVSERSYPENRPTLRRSLLFPGGVVPGLGLQTDSLNPLKSLALGRSREPESPPAACPFPQTSSPTLQGISMSLMGGMMGADGFTAQGVRSKEQPSHLFFPLQPDARLEGFYPVDDMRNLVTLSRRPY